MNKPNATPQSIREGTLTIFGVELKVHHLDNGQRIIEEESIIRLFERMAEPDCPTMSQRECELLARFIANGEL